MWYGIADLKPFEQYALFGVLFIAVLGLLYALFLRNQVLSEDTGTPAMLKVWTAIKEAVSGVFGSGLWNNEELWNNELSGPEKPPGD